MDNRVFPSIQVNTSMTSHDCPALHTHDHASCDHTATTYSRGHSIPHGGWGEPNSWCALLYETTWTGTGHSNAQLFRAVGVAVSGSGGI